MRNLFLSVAAITMLSSTIVAAGEPVPQARFSDGVYRPGDEPLLSPVQLFIFGGRNYCWYDSAWNGPGYYACGFAWRSGYGWGGAYGWNGWRGGHAGFGHGYGHGYGHGGHVGHGGHRR